MDGRLRIHHGASMARCAVLLAAAFLASALGLGQETRCEPGPEALCVDGARSRVTADWRTADGASGSGHAAVLTRNAGYFWFFDPGNLELVVKVLDSCSANGHCWTFAAGLTQVGVTLNVTDTATWASRTSTSAPGTPFAPVQDTSAFSTRP
jgi:hypothetical protein